MPFHNTHKYTCLCISEFTHACIYIHVFWSTCATRAYWCKHILVCIYICVCASRMCVYVCLYPYYTCINTSLHWWTHNRIGTWMRVRICTISVFWYVCDIHYMHVHVYACICTFVCICACICLHTYAYTHVTVHVQCNLCTTPRLMLCMYVFERFQPVYVTYTRMHIYARVCMNASAYTCVYECIYIITFIQTYNIHSDVHKIVHVLLTYMLQITCTSMCMFMYVLVISCITICMLFYAMCVSVTVLWECRLGIDR